MLLLSWSAVDNNTSEHISHRKSKQQICWVAKWKFILDRFANWKISSLSFNQMKHFNAMPFLFLFRLNKLLKSNQILIIVTLTKSVTQADPTDKI
jgi:hypothetical protein